MIVNYYTYKFGKPHYEEPKLIIRQIGGRQYYWNYRTGRWTRLTRRCPYL